MQFPDNHQEQMRKAIQREKWAAQKRSQRARIKREKQQRLGMSRGRYQ